ncbi:MULTISPECIES: hypothetical protein [Providencia]|uniref:hypothetical protein n=1 Tax=Providencia TaxID=586 RepID=UPI000BCDB3E8|nr:MULTISPECIES: hypothetical protein [Providencia]PCQ37963.1 hypothetical protein CQA26_11495 [Providencia rettgeri]BBU96512.1 hypothetical protein BML2496_23950 [Providencia rettgeri]
MTKPTYDFNKFQNLSQAVQHINDGAAQGFDDYTPEYLAAAYALGSAKETGYDDDASIEATLDFLVENGANFNFHEALKLATK